MDDVRLIRKVLDEAGGSHVKIISKIENEAGLRNIDVIIQARNTFEGRAGKSSKVRC